MSVTIWQENEKFTVRIYKRLQGRPDLLWSNSYEVVALDTVPNGDANARNVLEIFAAWESMFHNPDVVFDRGVFSTLVPDGQPYQPENFVVKGYEDVVGLRVLTSDPLNLEQCLFVRRNVNFGRVGRALYRRCLSEGEVTAPSGKTVLTPTAASNMTTAINQALPEPWAGNIFASLQDQRVMPVMVLRDGVGSGETRVITSFVASGVTNKKLNNKFFNRNTPQLPPVEP